MRWTPVLSSGLVIVAVAVLLVPTPRQEQAAGVDSGPAAVVYEQMRPGVNVLASAHARRALQGDFESYVATVAGQQAEVRVAPSIDSELLLELPATTEHGQPQSMLIHKEVQVAGETWFKVALPIRPNGSTGWVNSGQVRVSGVPYSLQVNLAAKRLDLVENGALAASYPIGVGREKYPTPGGTFYLLELLRPPDPGGVYGTRTYVLSGFSNVLTEFNGGDGELGIHGTNDDDTIGRDVSHGCIRMHNADIEALAAILPLGTPVRILT